MTRFRIYKIAWPPQDKNLGGKGASNQRHILRDRRPSAAAYPACWAMGTRNWNSGRWGKKYFVLGQLEQPRNEKPKHLTKEAPFHLYCTLWVPIHLSCSFNSQQATLQVTFKMKIFCIGFYESYPSTLPIEPFPERIEHHEDHARLLFGSHKTFPIIWIGKPAPRYNVRLRVERWQV